ncbi:DEAD/DEAH box helicase [Streptomyces sp. NPDC002265]|uniref:DEAD/DEAH box helicase n=1 Tax=Streptomyces sp. NPDC002265 TaxID=3154415 RepID=UPI003330EB98
MLAPEEHQRDLNDLRKLATALEAHAILNDELPRDVRRSCAFVAAEALSIVAEADAESYELRNVWLFGSQARYTIVETALLYLIAGYDSNAALTEQGIGDELVPTSIMSLAEEWVLQQVRSLLTLSSPSADEFPILELQSLALSDRARANILLIIGKTVRDHVLWLTYGESVGNDSEELHQLLYRMEHDSDGRPTSASHIDLHHLLLLLTLAIEETSARALRSVPPPADDSGRFLRYQRYRAKNRPLMWPGVLEYANRAFPGPHSHAVVSVPTGAGKSAVAEIAIAQALRDGWVLYLAPTNALVGQIRREIGKVFRADEGVKVREFLGGSEYTELTGEAIRDIDGRSILVMTPEKCSLALRQAPEIFLDLSLCIVDEAHMIGAQDSRAIIAELVVAEVLHRAPDVKILMLSALLANPGDISAWLRGTTGRESIVINPPWRPTRTLRAIVGFDAHEASALESGAKTALEKLPPRRVNYSFDVPISLLLGLQGAWQSNDLSDYKLMHTNVKAGLIYKRGVGAVDDGYCNRVVKSLSQALGEKDQRILVFLPRSRHDSFSCALQLNGFSVGTNTSADPDINALMNLADAEIGAPSLLRGALLKGVAVHTGAMLREEQRASEISFERDRARVLFATGTLAQGLNLPATTVIVGGTQIGWDPDADREEQDRRAQAQLLNAIGRAGRAQVSSRSLAIVVPNRGLVFGRNVNINQAIGKARFLAKEDASSEIKSQLDGIITGSLDGTLNIGEMTAAEQSAFTFLSFAGNRDDARGVIKKSWGAYRANAVDRASDVAESLENIGASFLRSTESPEWVALAAHRAGIPLAECVFIYKELRQRLEEMGPPQEVSEWASDLLGILEGADFHTLHFLKQEDYGGTILKDLWADAETSRAEAWQVFHVVLQKWMEGAPLLNIASIATGKDTEGKNGRGQADPLPKMIRIVNDGFGYSLTSLAGAIAAVVAAGREQETDGPWDLDEQSLRSLNLLPFAIRFGADSPVPIAWMRAGARPRVLAHKLSNLALLPDFTDDEELRRMAVRMLSSYPESILADVDSAEDAELILAMLAARKIT